MSFKTLPQLFICFMIFAVFNPKVARAQELIGPIKEYFEIDSIEMEGNRKVESEAIIEKISSKSGQMLDNYQLRKDIQRIYEMRYFDEVEAWHKQKGGKDILLFRLKEKPIIGKVEFKGNDEINDDDLKEQIKTKEFQILDVATLKNDVQALQKHYEEKGFFIAQASYQVKQNPNGSVDVVFNLKEWDKVMVKKITFLGSTNNLYVR